MVDEKKWKDTAASEIDLDTFNELPEDVRKELSRSLGLQPPKPKADLTGWLQKRVRKK